MTDTKSGAELDAILVDHETRIAALEADATAPPEPEPEPPAAVLRAGLDMRSYQLYVGADPNEPGEAILGPSWMGRTFSDPAQSAAIIAKGSGATILDAYQAKPYVQANRRVFHSMKPDVGKATNGDATTLNAIQAVAASMHDGDQFTVYHEPENDLTADQWWGMFRNCYDAAKQGRPGLSVVYCAMTYQHGTGQAAAGKSDDWCRDEPCDAFGCDDYGPHPGSGKNFDIPLGGKQNFQAWYKAASKNAGPGKARALQVHELGRSGGDPAAVTVRPKVLTDAYDYCEAAGFDLFLYWNNATGQSGTHWQLDDEASREAWRAIVARASG